MLDLCLAGLSAHPWPELGPLLPRLAPTRALLPRRTSPGLGSRARHLALGLRPRAVLRLVQRTLVRLLLRVLQSSSIHRDQTSPL